MCSHVGLRVTEVAHDHQVQVKKFVVEELHLKNSSDTWHGQCVVYIAFYIHVYFFVIEILVSTGTKGVARAITKIAQGPNYKEGSTWFRQLSDKRKELHTLVVNSC